MPRKVHDGPAMGTAQRTGPEQPQEWVLSATLSAHGLAAFDAGVSACG